MNEGLVTVRLHGQLGQEFGPEHHFAITTPLEAIRALDVNYPGFRRAFIQAERYYIRVDGDWRADEAITFPCSREIDIIPDVAGQAFIGAALIGAIIPTLAGTLTATILGSLLVTGLLLGVSLLLTPKPKKNTARDKDKIESNQFSGPDNLVGQGAAVPVVYGRCFVGSVVISVGIETGDVALPSTPGGK